MRAGSLDAATTTESALVAARDLIQKKRALFRNFPVIGHARYPSETIGPELRQYIVTSHEEERLFRRDRRTWIHASARGKNNCFGFGTDVDVEYVRGHAHLKQRMLAGTLPDAQDPQAALPSVKVLGGMPPGARVTPEIAGIRGIPSGKDCASRSRDTALSDVDSMPGTVEPLATETGVPAEVKSAVGEMGLWQEPAALMARGDRGVDFVTIDGGEGGTGAAPLIFTGLVSLPFRMGVSRFHGTFAGLGEGLTFLRPGKLGLSENAAVACAQGADTINVARETMLSIGCVQSWKCHTDTCPSGEGHPGRCLPAHPAQQKAGEGLGGRRRRPAGTRRQAGLRPEAGRPTRRQRQVPCSLLSCSKHARGTSPVSPSPPLPTNRPCRVITT